MADRLEAYRAKRDFGITAEPEGGDPAQGAPLSFVVQKHAARRLHYDFRLELDGVLKSWAVPKGPSLDPADKRMAVHVEDHPLDYGGFEGVIPPNQYGAGTVIVWDRGQWQPLGDPHAGYLEGKLKFELRGEKLLGHWTLVRMRGRGSERQEPWLLIKERDDAARPAAEYSVVDEQPDSVLSSTGKKRAKDAANASTPDSATAAAKSAMRGKRSRAAPANSALQAPTAAKSPAGSSSAGKRAGLPLALAPQLATLVDTVPSCGDWRYEIKFDGYRLLARIDGGDVRLFTRNGNDWTAKLKRLAKAVGDLGISSAWLDGEIVVQDARGVPDFQRLQNAFDSSRTDEILFYAFDLPFHDGLDLRERPLAERRDRLRSLLDAAPADRIRFSEEFEVAPSHLLHTVCQMRMEGVIGKLADSTYVSRRSASWIKLKCTQRQEFVIGGFTDPKGSRIGLGSLLLGVHDEGGKLRYAGNVGTGFDAKILADLSVRLAALRQPKPPFDDLPKGVNGHWVRPKLVAEVSFAEWTKDGRIRHSVYQGLRSDKQPRAITEEKPLDVETATAAAAAAGGAADARAVADDTVPSATPADPPARPRSKAHGGTTPAGEAGSSTSRAVALPGGIRVSHPARVVDAASGVTKLELAEYYAKAARRMLPHLKARPVSLVRGPEGVGGELFFQKHGEKLKIPGIRLLDPSFDVDHDPLLEVATAEALVGSVQMNVIEFHTWNATTWAIEQPDRMTFDLDPGEGIAWPQMIEAAQLLKAMLDALALESLLKTSGGKGLHVVVPFKPSLEWAAVKSLSQTIVQHLAKTLPERFVAKSGPKNRVGRIFVDYLRNGRGATTATAWSARARPGLGVSVPVEWSELETLTAGAQWTVRNVDERLSRPDPWIGRTTTRQSLKTAMRVLDFTP